MDIMELGHVHIKVRDLNRSVEFYQRLFDLEITELVIDRFAFLTGNEMHHQIALQARGSGASDPDPKAVGLFHVAFEANGKQEFADRYEQLRKMGIKPYSTDHRISWALYFDDPDGNGLEIYVDTRKDQEVTNLWKGMDRPLPEEKILAVKNRNDS